jgi:hypothetical protein
LDAIQGRWAATGAVSGSSRALGFAFYLHQQRTLFVIAQE